MHFDLDQIGFSTLILDSDLYGLAMRQNLPNGPGVLYERKENNQFEWKSMLTSVNWSLEAIKWLSYMNAQNQFKDYQIEHALNKGERKINIGSKTYTVDGFVKIGNMNYIFEFNGCRYHHCDCKISRESNLKKKDDRERFKDLATFGTLIVMKECIWNAFKRENEPALPICNFFGRKNITEIEIFEAIRNDRFYGLIQADIRSPPEVITYFSKVNHPPIFNHIEVTESMLGDHLKTILKEKKTKFPLPKQLSLTFNADKYLMTTDLAKFYLEKGMVISNLKLAIEFNRDQPLAEFVQMVTDKRKEATRKKDANLQNTFKLCMNSCYGKTGLNLEKLRKFQYVPMEKQPVPDESPFICQVNPVNGEFETKFVEVVKKKRKIVDTVPGMKYEFFLIKTKLNSASQITRSDSIQCISPL